MTAITYLIDLCPARAADSATLLSVVRFPIGAVVSASGATLVLSIGRTAMQVIFAVLAIHAAPIIYLLYLQGANMRAKHRLH